MGTADGSDPLTLQRIVCAAPAPTQPERLRPTYAGLFLVDTHPRDVIRHAESVCALVGKTVGRHRDLDRPISYGTPPEQIDQGEEVVQRHIRTADRTQGVRRDDARSDDAVRLFYDADRIEVQSPGILTPGAAPGRSARAARALTFAQPDRDQPAVRHPGQRQGASAQRRHLYTPGDAGVGTSRTGVGGAGRTGEDRARRPFPLQGTGVSCVEQMCETRPRLGRGNVWVQQ